jgi:hypothetical protein
MGWNGRRPIPPMGKGREPMDYFTMAIALTVVKAGAQLMLDVLQKNPNLKMPPNWPFISMDEFIAEVDGATEFYKDRSTEAAIDEAMRRMGKGEHNG